MESQPVVEPNTPQEKVSEPATPIQETAKQAEPAQTKKPGLLSKLFPTFFPVKNDSVVATKTAAPEKSKEPLLKKIVIPFLLVLVLVMSGVVIYKKKFAAVEEDPRATKKTSSASKTTGTPAPSTVVTGSITATPAKGGKNIKTSVTPTPQGEPQEVKLYGLNATYFNDINFLGSSETRIDDTVDFTWKDKGPIDKIDLGSFSARWSGLILAPTSESYSFYVNATDGVRLWVNGRQVINQWKDNPLTEYEANVSLAQGKFYTIKLEYFDLKDESSIKLSWKTPTIPKQVIPNEVFVMNKNGSGLQATYFNDVSFTKQVDSRIDTGIAFNLKDQKMSDKITSNSYSVRWEGKISAKNPQEYTYYVKSDNTIKIWIDNKLVLDKGDEVGTNDYIFIVPMKAETLVNIKIEYTHTEGDSILLLSWESRTQRYQTIPVTSLYPFVSKI
jgi:hypothetical protein